MKTMITLILLHLPLVGYAGIFDFFKDELPELSCEAGEYNILYLFNTIMHRLHFDSSDPWRLGSIAALNAEVIAGLENGIKEEMSAIRTAKEPMVQRMQHIHRKLNGRFDSSRIGRFTDIGGYANIDDAVAYLQNKFDKGGLYLTDVKIDESPYELYNRLVREKAAIEKEYDDLEPQVDDLERKHDDLKHQLRAIERWYKHMGQWYKDMKSGLSDQYKLSPDDYEYPLYDYGQLTFVNPYEASNLFFSQSFEINTTLVDRDEDARHITCTASIIGKLWIPLEVGRQFELYPGEPDEIGSPIKYEMRISEPTEQRPEMLWIKIDTPDGTESIHTGIGRDVGIGYSGNDGFFRTTGSWYPIVDEP